MRVSTFLLGCLVATVAMTTTSAVQAPQALHQCGSSSSSRTQSPFGSRQRWSLETIRGGAVVEPESADAVSSLLLDAASENKLVVIDFGATWCGPCKMIAPLFKELSDVFPDVVFVKIDVDDDPETAAKYDVSAMPTFLFLKNGEVVDRLMGASPTHLRDLIEEHM